MHRAEMFGAIFLPYHREKGQPMKNYENTQSDSTVHAPANDTRTVIRFGKINCLIKERFAEQGKELDEILEKLIVDKCRQSA